MLIRSGKMRGGGPCSRAGALILMLLFCPPGPGWGAAPKTMPEEWVGRYFRGAAHYELKQFRAAAGEFAALAAAQPHSAFIWTHLGMAHFSAQSYFKAVEPLKRALALDAGDLQARYFLARAAFEMEQYEEAVRHFRKAVAAGPREAALRFHLAKALAAGGDAAGAEKEYRETLALDPEHGGAHYRLGKLLLAAGRKEEGGALQREGARLSRRTGKDAAPDGGARGGCPCERLSVPDFGPPAARAAPEGALEVRLIKRRKADAFVSVRAGRLLLEKKMGPRPERFPLRGRRSADVVEVSWPDGTKVIKIGVPVGKPLIIEKKRRRGVGHRF